MISTVKRTINTSLKHGVLIILPWVLSALLVLLLIYSLFLIKQTPTPPEKDIVIRKVDVAMPIPPPPPPKMQTKSSKQSPSPVSIDLVSLGGGPALNYSDKPTMAMPKVERLEKPDFAMDSLKIQQRMTFDMPLMAVENLDKIPQVVSQEYFPPPQSIRKQGLKRVSTLVELIINTQGKPFIKKIVDPVHPDMVSAIRRWVEKAKFTIPKKDGRAVQAIYLYGIHFNYSRS
ncbi:hypothetical protein [Pseudoalteromonas aurantia]|uniref:TonB C-terminal domain-containing protein n=1 Tax=Pseudoalteromonas aurantia TaxID=43654 RepID=A0A5S3V7I9_9GAMM|nr:hypothetical protein [Pseudoalteromonas aurantia]TMO67801.1 hypothetical protein CWC19_11955 [Pseudoalteromonas aurantia]TMO78171.1 hypothetical protein CWC20_02060 [Pseudoalteromonas aurantia]